MFTAIFVFIVLAAVALIVLRLRGKNRFPWYEFYSKGRREGFSFKEIGFLKTITIQNKLDKPQSIFWSTRQLDRCLKPAIQKIHADETMSQAYKLEMVGKLLDLRTKAEFNLPKYKKKLRDTFSLFPRQKLVIKDRDYGAFVSWIVEINRKNLVVTHPAGQKASENLGWAGRKVLVSFWRADDAGYEFETKVLEQIKHEEYPLLYLAHSANLQRKQMRRAARVDVACRAMFYPIEYSQAEGLKKPFVSKRGYLGKIIDVSEGGCCMLAGRLLKKNARLKIEFDLTPQKHVVALGVVSGVSKTGDERVQKVHIMFVKIGAQSRHDLLIFVYNIFGEREEERRERRTPAAAAARRVPAAPGVPKVPAARAAQAGGDPVKAQPGSQIAQKVQVEGVSMSAPEEPEDVEEI